MKSNWLGWCLAPMIALAATEVLAQGRTVQLPTYSFTTVGTTVTVPDRGSAYLGGISRAASGRSEFGAPGLGKLPFVGRPFKNSAIGQERSASSFHVSATIHDFEAMEEALLGTSPSSMGAAAAGRRLDDSPAALAGRTLQPRAPNLAGNWLPKGESDAGGSDLKLADEQARRAARHQTRAEEAQQFFDRAQQAEADGKPNVAKIYYQMVARRAGGELQQQALARLEGLGGGQVAKVAQNRP